MVDLDPAEYLDSYHQRGFFRELESGRIGADEFVRRLGECAGREVSYAEAREAWLGFFLLPVPLERLACLEELRRDYRLYVLSNTNPFVMDWARSSEFSPAGKPLDAYFDKLFLSYEMKCMKPDRAIFDRMAAEAPLVPAETLFIDDSAANAAAGEMRDRVIGRLKAIALGTPEIMARTHFVASRTYEHLPLYITAGLIYFLITTAGLTLLRRLERKVRIPGYALIGM